MEPHIAPMAPTACPDCGAVLKGSVDVRLQGGSPQDADICFCFACGALLRFADRRTLRRATREERELGLTDPVVRRLHDELRRRRDQEASA